MGPEGEAMENREWGWKPGGQGARSGEGSSREQGMCRGRIYTFSNMMSWRPMDAHILMRTISTVSNILYREDHPLGPLLWASPQSRWAPCSWERPWAAESGYALPEWRLHSGVLGRNPGALFKDLFKGIFKGSV